MGLVVSLVLVAVCAGICWSMLAGQTEYVIRFVRGTVRFRGKFPIARQAEASEFFRKEFAGAGRITVSAVRTPQRGLRILVRGPISSGDRQRIRNFLQAR